MFYFNAIVEKIHWYTKGTTWKLPHLHATKILKIKPKQNWKLRTFLFCCYEWKPYNCTGLIWSAIGFLNSKTKLLRIFGLSKRKFFFISFLWFLLKQTCAILRIFYLFFLFIIILRLLAVMQFIVNKQFKIIFLVFWHLPV